MKNIQKKVSHLKELSCDDIDYIERCFMFVRDEIPHSWDIGAEIVSKKASEVLINKTGICWAKSCLLAALLRANEIPSGISYQLLTRADNDTSDGYYFPFCNLCEHKKKSVENKSKNIGRNKLNNKSKPHPFSSNFFFENNHA